MVEASTALANFSISESALHILSPQKYKNTSESDSKQCSKNGASTVNSVGSKNSLRRRRAKLRKKSYSSNKRSESGSELPDVSRNILRSMTKSESFSMGTSLMEDLSVAISMMNIVKDSQVDVQEAQKPESDEETKMMKPDFKIGSLTKVYGNQAANLGSLAALANYNLEKDQEQDTNETGTENMSSFSEQLWDNYMEKYNSEAYSEDRDTDGAKRLLDFGDDYRNFIDSQSDCCSSLSAANIDSLSPPRPRKYVNGVNATNLSLSSNDNSMKMLRQRRIQELPGMERRRTSNGDGKTSS
jgi:hypothetical protein